MMFVLVGLVLACGVILGIAWVSVMVVEWATTTFGETGSIISGVVIVFFIVAALFASITG
jgi:hypothetical protein